VRYVTYAAYSKPIILKCTERPSLFNGMQTRLYECAMTITAKCPKNESYLVRKLHTFNYIYIVFAVNTIIPRNNMKRRIRMMEKIKK
jgi:hypothetical protein